MIRGAKPSCFIERVNGLALIGYAIFVGVAALSFFFFARD